MPHRRIGISCINDGEVMLSSPISRNYWCDRFDISEAQLRTAVETVGPSITAIARYFGHAKAVLAAERRQKISDPAPAMSPTPQTISKKP